MAGRLFTIWATRKAQEYWSGQPIPSPGGLPDPGIELWSALQATVIIIYFIIICKLGCYGFKAVKFMIFFFLLESQLLNPYQHTMDRGHVVGK